MLCGPIWTNLADINKVIHILHSVHYNSITIIQTNKCTQLSYIYINIIKKPLTATCFGLYWPIHQGVQLLQKMIS